MRVCGDYKVTVNRAAKPDTYLLPHINDLFGSLAGRTTFTKPDLVHTYQQILLNEGSKKFVVINMHKGLGWHQPPQSFSERSKVSYEAFCTSACTLMTYR